MKLIEMLDVDAPDRVAVAVADYKLKAGGRKLLLYGAGNGGEASVRTLQRYGVTPDYVWDDRYPVNGEGFGDFYGTPITSIERALEENDKKLNVMVTFFSDVSAKLKRLGARRVFFYPEICVRRTSLAEFQEHSEEIERAYSLLSDEKSKRVMRTILNARLSGDLRLLADIYDEAQYFDDSIIKLTDDEVFADAGCFDGDTSRQFIKRVNGRYRAIYAFEPHPASVKLIRENMRGVRDFHLRQSGLYNQNATLKFFAQTLGTSKIADDGETEVSVETLDSLPIETPTFIKMDIEGSERAALEGAKKLIERGKPKMAICVYHKPNDLWELPLYIKELVPEYKIFMRHYSLRSAHETVAYAVAQ
jgi:FkbM family methyltransferase